MSFLNTFQNVNEKLLSVLELIENTTLGIEKIEEKIQDYSKNK